MKRNAGETRRAETSSGSVHEHAVAKGDAPNPCGGSSTTEVERVARAIISELWVSIHRWRAPAKCYRETDFVAAGFQVAASAEELAADCDRKADRNTEISFRKARAAISAMREPSEAMIEAAAATPGMKAASSAMELHQARGYGFDEGAFHDGSPLHQAWRAMIDAALSQDTNEKL